MYHPPDLVLGGVTNDNVIEEFIELYNAGATSVPLFDPLAPSQYLAGAGRCRVRLSSKPLADRRQLRAVSQL
jgi:hypothetical protein